MEERLRTEYTLEPPTREGRPPVYTDEQLAAGEEALSRPAQPFHSTAQLVQHLKEEGELPASATQRGYAAALRRHLASSGLQLAYGVRSKQQPITAAVAAQRLAWCKKMQHVITSTTVKQWHFVDEKPHSGSQLSTGGQGWLAHVAIGPPWLQHGGWLRGRPVGLEAGQQQPSLHSATVQLTACMGSQGWQRWGSAQVGCSAA